ncbi:MAG: HNH endonuclease [Caudoviricetes sp.]|nr:MAG: HNH endonuclease [Caudoviricetes sp.]
MELSMTECCSIDGCSKPVKARGWCGAHYWRFNKHGDPLGKTSRLTSKEWVEQHKDYKSYECLIWPFSRADNGYGRSSAGGRSISAHRLMCEAVHGEPPTNKHVAAHSCGNGRLGCVNPRHLRWATKTENEHDKFLHGTMPIGEAHHNSKLTNSDALAIRQLSKRSSLASIARRYGVATPTIWKIVHKVSWAHV